MKETIQKRYLRVRAPLLCILADRKTTAADFSGETTILFKGFHPRTWYLLFIKKRKRKLKRR